MSTRQDKVNSLLQRLVAEHIARNKFDGLTGLLTIKQVEVTGDLKHGKIYFSVVGQDPQETRKILFSHLREIQRMINSKLQMKNVPRLTFLLDNSGEYADHIARIIHQLHQENGPKSTEN